MSWAHVSLPQGFRMVSYESGYEEGRLHTFIRRYLLRHEPKRSPAWLLDPCGPNTSVRQYSYQRCGDMYGVYNNWFVSSVAFWRSAPVRAFLAHVDEAGVIYTRRLGDLNIQSAALQIYLPRSRVLAFDDFTYEHTTLASRPAYNARARAGRVGERLSTKAAAAAAAAANSTGAVAVAGRTSVGQCIDFGGIAAGTRDPDGYHRVLRMVKPFKTR